MGNSDEVPVQGTVVEEFESASGLAHSKTLRKLFQRHRHCGRRRRAVPTTWRKFKRPRPSARMNAEHGLKYGGR